MKDGSFTLQVLKRRVLADHARVNMMFLVAPFIRMFPPWWKTRMYIHLVGSPFLQGGYYGKVKHKRVYPHRYQMALCLDDWMERFAYFVGCYYEIDATATVLNLLRKGDCFIDVGANLGFMSLTASKVVGPSGRVLAFEPNKSLVDRLTLTLLVNKINNVIVHAVALGDEEREAILDTTAHSGTSSLRHNLESGTKVNVLCGDRFISEPPEPTWIFVKLDVEGYELRALKGFQSLLRRPRTGFLVEITDEWLRIAGGSADELFDLMFGNGYKAYVPRCTFLSQFELRPTNGPIPNRYQYDVVFLRSEDNWHSRTS